MATTSNSRARATTRKISKPKASAERTVSFQSKNAPKTFTTVKKPTQNNAAMIGGARGMGFESIEDQAAISAEDKRNIELGGSITGGRDLTYSTGAGSPTIMTNANKIERVVPLLDSRASSLSSFNLSGDNGGANFTNTGNDAAAAGGGEDEISSFEEALGLSPEKKKKKEEDGFKLTPMETQQMALLEQMQKTQDKRLRQSISQARKAFSAREAEARDVNNTQINLIKQALNLGGSSRYAPISSGAIISAQEQAGIKAVAQLDALEQKTIAEIQEARDQLDYQTLEKKFIFLDGLRKEKATVADELDATVKEREDQMAKDTAIAELIAQGTTSPIEIFNSLNASGDTNIPLSEIVTALKGLEEVGGTGVGSIGFELDNKGVGTLIGNGWTIPEIEAMQADIAAGVSIDDVLAGVDPDMQDAVKAAFGINETTDTTVTPGLGAKTSLEESVIRTRLFSKIAPILNKGALSDSDREIIDGRIAEFRDAGMGEQEILDTLAGIPNEVNTPYNGMFRDLIVANSDTMEKQTSNIGRLSQQLSKGNYMGAMNTVENQAMTEARKLDPDNYLGTGTAQYALKTSDNLRNLLSDAEDVLGPLEGTIETIKGKLARSKDPKAAKISAEIAKLTAPMRNQLSGTAVTASETAFLEPLIPSLSDTIENLNVKIDALESQTLDRYNTTRSMVSLPQATKEQVLDPKKRLILYSNDIYLPTNNSLDI